jgi:hypothetical protein
MRKATAYIFFILYLFLTTEAYQVLKIPVILEHFHEHQKENKDITLLEFLNIHYMHGSPMDADYERDMQLPFKRVNQHIHASSLHVKDLTTAQLSIPLPPKESEFLILDDKDIQSPDLSPIFQPPKA